MRLNTFVSLASLGYFLSASALPATSDSSSDHLTLLDGSGSAGSADSTASADTVVAESSAISSESMAFSSSGSDATLTMSNAAALPSGSGNSTHAQGCGGAFDGASIVRRANRTAGIGADGQDASAGECQPPSPSGSAGVAGAGGSGGAMGGGNTVTITVTVTEDSSDTEETGLASFASGDDASFIGSATGTLDSSVSEATSISDTTSSGSASNDGSSSNNGSSSDQTNARLAKIRRRVRREREASRKLTARRF